MVWCQFIHWQCSYQLPSSHGAVLLTHIQNVSVLLMNNMMTSVNGNIFCFTGPFVSGIHRSPLNSPRKGSDAELWCVLWSVPEQTAEQTSRSENDDTPQPLDQWTNSPFIGQQAGNWSICHALWPIRKSIVHPTLYPTHISFISSQSNFPFLKYGY